MQLQNLKQTSLNKAKKKKKKQIYLNLLTLEWMAYQYINKSE